jgi:outer membrane protein assembly factor BamD (BamD/ComL family)
MLVSLMVVAAGLVAVRAQNAPSQPSAFWPKSPATVSGAGASLELEARRALNIGLPSIAAALYRKIYDDPNTSQKTRSRVAVDLVTALLEEDRFLEAAQFLQSFADSPTPELRLRRAMVAVRERRFDVAKAESQSLSPDELSPYDRGWLFFLRGQLVEESRDNQAAAKFYQQAEEATSATGLEAQRAWFLLAKKRLSLKSGGATDVTELRKTIDKNPGSPQAYAATSQLAVGLTQLGQRAEAIELLQKRLLELPRQERVLNDEWQLLLGLIAKPEEGAGWVALRNLLMNSTNRDSQRVALRLLSGASGTTSARRDEFGKLLDQLIAAPTPHPILEYLLLFRAQTALADNGAKRYAQAENDANRLLTEFPASPLKAAALGVLAESAWEQGFYRFAATHAAKARAELPPGETRAQLGVLLAEAYFRAAETGKSAADYRTAADAYGAALAEVPVGLPAGDLMFQRVLSSINAGELDAAEAILDEYSRDPRLEAAYRWQMEWSLARALQAAGSANKAYQRVNQLLDNALTAAALAMDLRASMAWLQARLAFENNDSERTLRLAETLLASLEGVEASLKAAIASNALLLQAQAGFELKNAARTSAALETLKKLRADYPGSEAAVYSYIVEADAADTDGRVLDAQRLVVELADKFKKSEYAPYALYRAALYAERRGPDRQYYEEANRILENLVTTYPDDGLVFYARLKQGNLLRSMNEWGRARTLYADLVNNFKFPQFADALAGSLALADTEAALAASDPARASSAAAIYEDLYIRQSASLDLRAEAGHKLGLYRADRESPERAYAIWWPMIEAFVLEDSKSSKLGANGRYWMVRTILKLAALQESQSKPQEARRLYELILEKKLPGVLHANEGLMRTGGKPAANAHSTAR